MSIAPDFPTLERLRNKLSAIRRNHVSTMAHYVNAKGLDGFWHQPDERDKSSLSSTATCVSSLVKSKLWQDPKNPLHTRAAAVATRLISKNTSAGLPPDNPFSLSFIAEGVLDLLSAEPGYADSDAHRTKINNQIAPLLLGHIQEGVSNMKGKLGLSGSSSIAPYPPSAYLTQLVVRVLLSCNCEISAETRSMVHAWARGEINKQVALLTAKSRNSDSMQLAYALIVAVTTSPDEKTSPEDKEIFRHALALFFGAQNQDGSWPLSRPLFHYPKVGNAYCFDFELLTQLLACRQLWDDLLDFVPNLEKSTLHLDQIAFDLNPDKPGTVIGWASGHHPQLQGPESWSTASVYHYAYALDRLVTEALRRALFDEVRVVYSSPPAKATKPPDDHSVSGFAPGFLDADLHVPGETQERSLRETLAQRFVYPIAKQAKSIRFGGRLSDETPMSAILFGPPGTSKTELAKIIAGYLNWPLLTVDPSYLVQEGLDKVQAMANRLFSMLVMSEEIVVLLDEFDELGRNRARNEDMLSRFITTAMLPKLAAINKERKLVFLLATNFISGFDAAFRRGGRFDMLLQVMPPNLKAKLAADPERFPDWAATLGRCTGVLKGEELEIARQRVGDLTYLETKLLVRELANKQEPAEISAVIKANWENCTLEKPTGSNPPFEQVPQHRSVEAAPVRGEMEHVVTEKWRDACKREEAEIRLPPVY